MEKEKGRERGGDDICGACTLNGRQTDLGQSLYSMHTSLLKLMESSAGAKPDWYFNRYYNNYI